MKTSTSSILLLLVFSILIFGTSSAKQPRPIIVEDTAQYTELNGTSYMISHFTPKFFLRTVDFHINVTQCLHYSFKLLERRVKLSSYTCLNGEGGFCSMDRFAFPEDKEGCTYMRPWSHPNASWHFYFNIERRPRKYGRYYEQRVREGKRKRHIASTKKELSTKPIGYLTLYGVVDCDQVCTSNTEGTKLGSYSDGTFHRGKYHRLN